MTPPPAVSLAREVLRRGRPFRDRARGGSMRPWLPAGSDLEVVPVRPGDLRVGDIVLVALPAHGATAPRLVAHRLLVAPGRGGGPVRTKGDRAPRPDPPLAAADVLGLVVAATPPEGGRRDLRRPAARVCGLLAALLSPWLGVAETVYRSLRRPAASP